MVRYMKCPRCELNYIDAEKQTYCEVCQKEMKGISLDIDEMDETDEELATELCPICNENMMRAGEKMCEECRKKAELEEQEADPEEDDEWREYLDDDTEDTELDGELDESLKEEFGDEVLDDEEEEDEVYEDDEEDLEYVTGDEIYSIPDDEEDEDEDSEDDDF